MSTGVTGIYPYGRYAVSERVTVWGVAGYGAGSLVLKQEDEAAKETDMDLMMAAVGLRGVAMKAPESGGTELAVKSDAMVVRTTSDAVQGLEAATAEVTRLRLADDFVMAFEDARSGRRMLNVLGNPAKEGEGMHMPVDPRLCRRRRVSPRAA